MLNNGQWYERDPRLRNTEVKALSSYFPDATFGKLSDGRMTCQVVFMLESTRWHIFLIYSKDCYTNKAEKAEISVYPVTPTYDALHDLAVKKKCIKETDELPHMKKDEYGNPHFIIHINEKGVTVAGLEAIMCVMSWARNFYDALKESEYGKGVAHEKQFT